MIVSGSWDSTIKVWDPRTKECVATCPHPDRVYTMDLALNHLIVGTACRHVWIWDIRMMDEPEQRRESPLNFQTRCIKAFPDGTGFCLSSIEARVAVAFIDPSDAVQSRKFAFRCHRHVENNVECAYPVNAIAIHPEYDSVLTGGSDGYVYIWNIKERRKVTNYRPYGESISSLALNRNASYLAIASSYCYEEGEKENKSNDRIIIRKVNDELVTTFYPQ